jgi:hypothetical protein
LAGPDWQAIVGPEMPLHRRLVARGSLAMMRLALEISPAFTIRLSKLVSWIRMSPRLLLSRLKRLFGHVRH